MTASEFTALRARAGSRNAVAEKLEVGVRVLFDCEHLEAYPRRTLYAYAVRGVIAEKASRELCASLSQP